MPEQTDRLQDHSISPEIAQPSAGELESTLATIWADALERDTAISARDNFFELGGDSLAMTIVLFQINEKLGVDLSPAALLEAPCLADFCGSVMNRINGKN